MIIAWIIGLLLSSLGIYYFKNSRVKANYEHPERPVLKMWHLISYILLALIPIFNIFTGIIMIIFWYIAVYGDEDWECTKKNYIMDFLNKPIY